MIWDTFQIESEFKHVGLEERRKPHYLEKIPGKQKKKSNNTLNPQMPSSLVAKKETLVDSLYRNKVKRRLSGLTVASASNRHTKQSSILYSPGSCRAVTCWSSVPSVGDPFLRLLPPAVFFFFPSGCGLVLGIVMMDWNTVKTREWEPACSSLSLPKPRFLHRW